MSKALVLGAVALVLSAASALADGWHPQFRRRHLHRLTSRRRSMQPRFIQYRKSTSCRLLSTQHHCRPPSTQLHCRLLSTRRL
jgi:hypothetical protein